MPQSQFEEYSRVVGSERVLCHPDAVKGLTPKLNWILAEWDKSGHRDFCFSDSIVFLDDDLLNVQRCFTEKGEAAAIRDPELIEAIITNTARLARDVGAKFFGWDSTNNGVRYYTGLKPFSLTGYITGCAKGFLRGHGLRYDERIVTKDDYDISAQNAWKHRLCFKDTRYSFVQKGTFQNTGGLAAFRTNEVEKRDVALLQKKWGDIFHLGGHSGTRKRDYAGVQKITMHLPF